MNVCLFVVNYLKGKMIMAAGRGKAPMIITFTAMILAVIRQVINKAVITTNRYDTLMAKSSAAAGRSRACR